MKTNTKARFSILIAVGFLGMGPEEVPKPPPTTITIFEMNVGQDGQKLVFVRGPDISPSQFKFLKDAEYLKQSANFFELRVELKTPNRPNIIIATSLRREMANDPSDRGISVLAADTTPVGFDLVVAEGSWICLWRAPVGGINTLSQLLDGWSDLQVPYTVPKSGTTASLASIDGRCRVVITEGDTGLQTTFEQQARGRFEMPMIGQRRVPRLNR